MTTTTLNTNGGVLLYAGKLGGKDIILTGATDYISVSATRDPFYSLSTYTISATLNPANLTWETGATMPVDPEALMVLARKYRAEYDDLREKMAILRALGG